MTQASCLLSVLSWRSSGQKSGSPFPYKFPRHPCQVGIYKDLSPNLLVSKSGLLIKSPRLEISDLRNYFTKI